AFTGVVGAAVYALRVFIDSMHNRVGKQVVSREVGLPEAAAIAPVIAVILVLAFYPQFVLKRTQTSTAATVAATALQGPVKVASR
ncbi:MAG: hypothetical protein JO372_03570, partial [Solirubrobacterales bacterium]|nr:hypothetical protein [Solirubrobacterales bacterium]